VAEMIRAELHLETIRCSAVRQSHHTGIVAQHVQVSMLGTEGPSKIAHRFKNGKVQFHYLDRCVRMRGGVLSSRGPRLLDAPAGKHH
jgi:hypothetical protein